MNSRNQLGLWKFDVGLCGHHVGNGCDYVGAFRCQVAQHIQYGFPLVLFQQSSLSFLHSRVWITSTSSGFTSTSPPISSRKTFSCSIVTPGASISMLCTVHDVAVKTCYICLRHRITCLSRYFTQSVSMGLCGVWYSLLIINSCLKAVIINNHADSSWHLKMFSTMYELCRHLWNSLVLHMCWLQRCR